MKIYKYKDNVDTDVIIPARYLNSFDAKELASHAMADIDATFASTVEKETSLLQVKTLVVVLQENMRLFA